MAVRSLLLLVVAPVLAQAQPTVRVGGRTTVDVFIRERLGLTRLDATMGPATGPEVTLLVELDGGRFDLPDGGLEAQRAVTIPTGASGADGGFYRVVTPGPFSLSVSGPGFTPTTLLRTARPTFLVEDFEGTLFDVQEPPGNVTGQLVILPGILFQQCAGVLCVDAGVRPRAVAGAGRGGSTALQVDDPGAPFTHYQFVRDVERADSLRALYARLWVRPTVRGAADTSSFFRFFEVNAGGLAVAAYDVVGAGRLRVRYNFALAGSETDVFTALDGGWRLVEAEVTGLGTADAGLRTAIDGVVVNSLELDRSGVRFRPTALIWGSVFSGASGLDLSLVTDDLAVALTPMASHLTLTTDPEWEAGRCQPVAVTLRDSFDGGPAPSYFPLRLVVPADFTLHTASDCGSPTNPTIEGTPPVRTLYARAMATGVRAFSIDAPTLLPTPPVSITVLPPDGGTGGAGGGTAGGAAAGGNAGGAAAGGNAGGSTAGGNAGGAAAGGNTGGGASGGGSDPGAADAGPDAPPSLAVGCGCGSSPGSLAVVLGVVALSLGRRKRRTLDR